LGGGAQVTVGARVALRNDSYTLHLLLPTKVDPLVSLMKVEKVPDSTYDMIGGLDHQIKEIKEARLAPPRAARRPAHGLAAPRALARRACACSCERPAAGPPVRRAARLVAGHARASRLGL